MIDGMPKPGWQSNDGSVVLYCADCLDILPRLPAQGTLALGGDDAG